MTNSDFLELFFKISGDYSIGVHGITGDGDCIEKAEKILQEGLKNKGWGGILSNVQMYGQKKKMTDDDTKDLVNYFFGHLDHNKYANIVVAIPDRLSDINGEEYFLGYFNKVSGYAKGIDKAGDSLPLNQMVENTKIMPKEFIVGYYYSEYNSDKFVFIPNPKFIGFMSSEEQMLFFEKIKDELIKNFYLDTPEALIRKLTLLKNFGITYNTEYHRQLEEYCKEKNKNITV